MLLVSGLIRASRVSQYRESQVRGRHFSDPNVRVWPGRAAGRRYRRLPARLGPIVHSDERQLSGSTKSLHVLVVHRNTWGIPVCLRKERPIGKNEITELLSFRLRVAPMIAIAKRSGIFAWRKLKG